MYPEVRMPWPGFEPQYLHLCVWVYNDFFISSIYQQQQKGCMDVMKKG